MSHPAACCPGAREPLEDQGERGCAPTEYSVGGEPGPAESRGCQGALTCYGGGGGENQGKGGTRGGKAPRRAQESRGGERGPGWGGGNPGEPWACGGGLRSNERQTKPRP